MEWLYTLLVFTPGIIGASLNLFFPQIAIAIIRKLAPIFLLNHIIPERFLYSITIIRLTGLIGLLYAFMVLLLVICCFE